MNKLVTLYICFKNAKCSINIQFHLLLCLLSGIGDTTRKIALKLKQKKVIEVQGDRYTITSLSTFRKYIVSFKVGQTFEESTKGLDSRRCKVLAKFFMFMSFMLFLDRDSCRER